MHVVEERGELLLLPLPCSFSYAVQRLGHTSPALRPVRALLVRVSLGPRPWLRQLRCRSPGFVHRLHRYYVGVRLLWIVHQRLRLLTFPLRTIRPQQRLWPIQRSPGSRARSVRTCQGLRPRRVWRALAMTHPPVLPSVKRTTSAPEFITLSRLNGWPIRSPTDASQSSSRTTAHGSGTTWVATPSSQWTFTTYPLPVSRRTHSRYRPPDRSAAHGDLCHEAPALPVTRPSRSSATRSIDNSLGGFFLHR